MKASTALSLGWYRVAQWATLAAFVPVALVGGMAAAVLWVLAVLREGSAWGQAGAWAGAGVAQPGPLSRRTAWEVDRAS